MYIDNLHYTFYKLILIKNILYKHMNLSLLLYIYIIRGYFFALFSFFILYLVECILFFYICYLWSFGCLSIIFCIFGSCHNSNTHKRPLKKKSQFLKMLICILQDSCMILLFQRVNSQIKSACPLFNNSPNKQNQNMPNQRGKLTYSEPQISVGTTIFQSNVPGHMPPKYIIAGLT